MKKVYDIEALMARTGASSYSELQEMGYDVKGYLRSQVETLEGEIQEIEDSESRESTWNDDDDYGLTDYSWDPSSENYIGT